MAELNQEIIDEIEILKATSFEEIEYLSDHDWTDLKKRSERIKQYDFAFGITTRNLQDAIRFHKMASSDLSHPEIVEVLDMFKKFYEVFIKRFEDYRKKHDWKTYADNKPEGQRSEDIQEEMSFQSKIVKEVTIIKSSWRKIDSGGMTGSVDIAVFSDVRMPIMFEELVLDRHSDVSTFIETRRIKDEARKKNK